MLFFELYGGVIIDLFDKLWIIVFFVVCGFIVCLVFIGDVIWVELKEICDDLCFMILLILLEFI